MRSHSMEKLIFIGEKLVLDKLESPLILFYIKRKNKTKNKTLKKWLHSFGKTSLEKLGLRFMLPIGKVPLKDNIPLSLKEVPTN